MPTIEVIRRIHALSDVTDVQQKVMRFMEFAYRDLPFMSVDDVASGSDVSKASVVRLVQKLGYASFDELKKQVRESVYPSHTSTSPAERIKQVAPPNDIGSVIDAHLERQLINYHETFANLDRGEISGLCATLIASERVWVYGQRFSYGLAFNLGLLLSQLLPAVFTVSGEAGTTGDSFSGVTTNDHVLIVAHRRIGSEKAALVEFLEKKGVAYSLITDAEDELIRRHARHVIRTCTSPSGVFNLYASSYVAIEVIASVLEAFAPTARQRLTDSEVAFQHLRTFRA